MQFPKPPTPLASSPLSATDVLLRKWSQRRCSTTAAAAQPISRQSHATFSASERGLTAAAAPTLEELFGDTDGNTELVTSDAAAQQSKAGEREFLTRLVDHPHAENRHGSAPSVERQRMAAGIDAADRDVFDDSIFMPAGALMPSLLQDAATSLFDDDDVAESDNFLTHDRDGEAKSALEDAISDDNGDGMEVWEAVGESSGADSEGMAMWSGTSTDTLAADAAEGLSSHHQVNHVDGTEKWVDRADIGDDDEESLESLLEEETERLYLAAVDKVPDPARYTFFKQASDDKNGATAAAASTAATLSFFHSDSAADVDTQAFDNTLVRDAELASVGDDMASSRH